MYSNLALTLVIEIRTSKITFISIKGFKITIGKDIPAIKILSQIASKSAPNCDWTFNFLAIIPSKASVIKVRPHTTKAPGTFPEKNKILIKIGAIAREKVSILGICLYAVLIFFKSLIFFLASLKKLLIYSALASFIHSPPSSYIFYYFI